MRIALVIVAILTRTAAADWHNPYTGNTWNNPISSTLDTFIQGRIQEKALWASFAKKNGAQPQSTAKHQPYTKTDFRPGRQRLVVDSVIATVAQTPEQHQVLANAMERFFDRYERTTRKYNVAYAIAFLIRTSLQVNGKKLDDAQGEQLALTINDMFALSPQFMMANATDRQKLYEMCVTVAGLIAMFDDMGKQDLVWANAAKLLARQSLAMLGMK
jgi:hypothetical protein